MPSFDPPDGPPLPDPKRLDRLRTRYGALLEAAVREDVAAIEAYARARVRAIAEDQAADRPGDAMLARPRETVVFKHRISANRAKTERRDVFRDVHLMDRMRDRGQLPDPCYVTAQRLYALWLQGQFDPVETSSYEPYLGRSWRHGTDETPDPQQAYRRVTAPLPSHDAALVDGLMLRRHPGPRLSCLQSALIQIDGFIDSVLHEMEECV